MQSTLGTYVRASFNAVPSAAMSFVVVLTMRSHTQCRRTALLFRLLVAHQMLKRWNASASCAHAKYPALFFERGRLLVAAHAYAVCLVPLLCLASPGVRKTHAYHCHMHL